MSTMKLYSEDKIDNLYSIIKEIELKAKIVVIEVSETLQVNASNKCLEVCTALKYRRKITLSNLPSSPVTGCK